MTTQKKALDALDAIYHDYSPVEHDPRFDILRRHIAQSDPQKIREEVLDEVEREVRSQRNSLPDTTRMSPYVALTEALSRIRSLRDQEAEGGMPGGTGKLDRNGDEINMGQLVRLPSDKVVRVGYDPVTQEVCYLHTSPPHIAGTPYMSGLGDTSHVEALPFDWTPEKVKGGEGYDSQLRKAQEAARSMREHHKPPHAPWWTAPIWGFIMNDDIHAPAPLSLIQKAPESRVWSRRRRWRHWLSCATYMSPIE